MLNWIEKHWQVAALVVLGLVIAVALIVGCNPTTTAPLVEPDLQPKADALAEGLGGLYPKVAAALKAETKVLADLAAEHRIDVSEQRRRVDEALAKYEALGARLDALSKEAASARKYEIVLRVAGMTFALALIAVLIFYPTPSWLTRFKSPLIFGLIGSLVVGAGGWIFERYARALIWGSVGMVAVGIAALVGYAILSGKYKDWLGKITTAISKSTEAKEIAGQVKAAGTEGLTAEVLDENDSRVEPG